MPLFAHDLRFCRSARGRVRTGVCAKRVILLNVSGPFHSPMMETAGQQLARVLENVRLNQPVIPYVSNVTADFVGETGEIKDLFSVSVLIPLIKGQIYLVIIIYSLCVKLAVLCIKIKRTGRPVLFVHKNALTISDLVM